MVNDTPSSATTPPKRTSTSRTATSGAAVRPVDRSGAATVETADMVAPSACRLLGRLVLGRVVPGYLLLDRPALPSSAPAEVRLDVAHHVDEPRSDLALEPLARELKRGRAAIEREGARAVRRHQRNADRVDVSLPLAEGQREAALRHVGDGALDRRAHLRPALAFLPLHVAEQPVPLGLRQAGEQRPAHGGGGDRDARAEAEPQH